MKSNVVPEAKKKTVSELTKLVKESKTILVASIKNLPASEFQEIGKKLRGKAIIKVPKKSLISRAIDESKNEKLKEFKDKLEDSIAILFSSLDSYELASELLNKKSPAKAKPGQIATEDIEIPAGPTDLTPGPAISELGALGIQIQIKAGKIEIAKPKIIAKKGEAISQGASDIMSKLDIKPFTVGYIPLFAFDSVKGVLYKEIKINREETVKELVAAYGKALPFAVNIGYANDETIKLMISKAAMYEKAIANKLSNSSPEAKTSEGGNN